MVIITHCHIMYLKLKDTNRLSITLHIPNMNQYEIVYIKVLLVISKLVDKGRHNLYKYMYGRFKQNEDINISIVSSLTQMDVCFVFWTSFIQLKTF